MTFIPDIITCEGHYQSVCFDRHDSEEWSHGVLEHRTIQGDTVLECHGTPGGYAINSVGEPYTQKQLTRFKFVFCCCGVEVAARYRLTNVFPSVGTLNVGYSDVHCLEGEYRVVLSKGGITR